MVTSTDYLDDETGINSSYVYDANGNVTEQTDARGHTSYSYYDSRNLLTHQVDAENYLTTFAYDADGNVVEQLRYATALTSLDPNTAPTPIIDNTKDQISLFSYDEAGQLVRSLDAEGYLTTTGYDALGNVDETTRYYEQVGNINVNVTTITNDNDATTTYDFDDQGRLTRVTDPRATSIYEEFKYDALGQQVEFRNKAGGITRYSYDSRGLMTESRVALATYDGTGSLIGAQNVTQYEYDIRGLQLSLIHI